MRWRRQTLAEEEQRSNSQNRQDSATQKHKEAKDQGEPEE
jgi:hypothetical protein